MSINSTNSIEILLSVYKPNLTWLDHFLDSIASQTYACNKILVRFDDSGPAVLKHSSNLKFTVLEDSSHVGPARSYFLLMKESTGDLVLFSDQDDLWISSKIEMLVNSICHQNLPALSFCDFQTIDERGSLFEYRKLIPSKISKYSFLFANSIPGNCMILNRKLIRLVNESIEVAGVPSWHDWWSLSVAREFGLILKVREVGVHYRIHQDNYIGIKSGFNRLRIQTKQFTNREPIWLEQIRMLVSFLEVQNIASNNLEFLRGLISYHSLNRFKRFKYLLLNGLIKADPIDIFYAVVKYVLPSKLVQ